MDQVIKIKSFCNPKIQIILKVLLCPFQIIKQPFQICMKHLALVPVISHFMHVMCAAAVTRYLNKPCYVRCIFTFTLLHMTIYLTSSRPLTGLLYGGIEAVCVPMSPRAFWGTGLSCCWLSMHHAVGKLPRLVSIFMCHLSAWKQPISWVLLSRGHNVRC